MIQIPKQAILSVSKRVVSSGGNQVVLISFTALAGFSRGDELGNLVPGSAWASLLQLYQASVFCL
jgi:hypothetical protein